MRSFKGFVCGRFRGSCRPRALEQVLLWWMYIRNEGKAKPHLVPGAVIPLRRGQTDGRRIQSGLGGMKWPPFSLAFAESKDDYHERRCPLAHKLTICQHARKQHPNIPRTFVWYVLTTSGSELPTPYATPWSSHRIIFAHGTN